MSFTRRGTKRAKIGKECISCGKKGNFPFHCPECMITISGTTRSRKSKNLCQGCTHDKYNQRPIFRDQRLHSIAKKSCWRYETAILQLKDVFTNEHTPYPRPRWVLHCFRDKYKFQRY